MRRRRRSPGPETNSATSMTELVHATAVEVLANRRLRVRFDDGSFGEVGFGKDDFRGVFEPLRDPAYFARVFVDDELGTIVWPNGADIAPETLLLWATQGRVCAKLRHQ